MTEKNKQRLLAAGLIVLGLVLLWLLLHQNQAVPATQTPTVENNQGAGQVPSPGGTTYPASNNTVGPLTYNVGGLGPTNITNGTPMIPSLAGLQMPGFYFNNGAPPGTTTDACCSSCGCDSTSQLNQFAAGVGAALSNYAQQMNTLEANYQTSLFGSLPDYISQYVSSAAPGSPVSVIGA